MQSNPQHKSQEVSARAARMQEIEGLPALVADMLQDALRVNATDIHVDPVGMELYRICYRVDGRIHPQQEIPIEKGRQLINQIKVAAGFTPDRSFTALENRISLEHEKAQRELRVTIVPTTKREAAHLRMLSPPPRYFSQPSWDSPTTTVERGGEKREIEAEALVPGDLVHLGSGDKVPADLRVTEASNAQVDEAILTGELTPVKKAPDPVSEDEDLGDRQSMAYAGTVVTSGKLQGIVVATGQNTEIGRISEMVSHVETLQTPLLRRIDTFGHYLAAAILGLSAVVFGIGYFLLISPRLIYFWPSSAWRWLQSQRACRRS